MSNEDNSVFEYKYVSPATKGYVLTKLKRKHLNKVLKHQIPATTRVSVWWNENVNTFIVEKYTAHWAIFINFIMLPFALLFYGVSNYKEIIKDHMDMLQEQKKGKFVSDTWTGHWANKLKEELQNEQ